MYALSMSRMKVKNGTAVETPGCSPACCPMFSMFNSAIFRLTTFCSGSCRNRTWCNTHCHSSLVQTVKACSPQTFRVPCCGAPKSTALFFLNFPYFNVFTGIPEESRSSRSKFSIDSCYSLMSFSTSPPGLDVVCRTLLLRRREQ